MPDTEPPGTTAPDRGAQPEAGGSRAGNGTRDDNEGWYWGLLRGLFGWKPGSIREDLEVVLQDGAPDETGFSPSESTMLKNVLGLRERRVEDVMVPRADIVAVSEEIALGELLKVFKSAAHSRLVVYHETLDAPTGMVHIRDLIAFMMAQAAAPNGGDEKARPAGLDLGAIDLCMSLLATRIVREILFVPPSMPAIDLLAKMQATRIHLALVIDEYGGTDGLVSIEDIVEQIVGDIGDEHDEEEAPSVVPQPDGSFIADARANLEDVVATVGAEFDVGELVNEVDTLGGYLVTQLGRVPVRSEIVTGPGSFEIEVLDADPRRVKRVRIHRSKARRVARSRELKRRDLEADGATAAVPTEGTAERPAVEQTETPPRRVVQHP